MIEHRKSFIDFSVHTTLFILLFDRGRQFAERSEILKELINAPIEKRKKNDTYKHER